MAAVPADLLLLVGVRAVHIITHCIITIIIIHITRRQLQQLPPPSRLNTVQDRRSSVITRAQRRREHLPMASQRLPPASLVVTRCQCEDASPDRRGTLRPRLPIHDSPVSHSTTTTAAAGVEAERAEGP